MTFHDVFCRAVADFLAPAILRQDRITSCLEPVLRESNLHPSTLIQEVVQVITPYLAPACGKQPTPPIHDWQHLILLLLTVSGIFKRHQSQYANAFEGLTLWLDFHENRLADHLSKKQEGQRSLEGWMSFCARYHEPSPQSFFELANLSPVAEMRFCVFDEEGRLRSFFQGEGPGAHYIPRLSDWFLRHYDLPAARGVYRIALAEEDLTRFPQWNSVFEVTPCLDQLLLKRSTRAHPLFHILYLYHFAVVGIMALWAFAWTHGTPTQKMVTGDGQALGLAEQFSSAGYYRTLWCVAITIGLFTFSRWLSILLGQPIPGRPGWLLPRLGAGVMVGHIPLLTGIEVWQWLITAPGYISVMMIGGFLLVTYAYLYAEAGKALLLNRSKPPRLRRELHARALHILTIGLLQALLISLVCCELVSPMLFDLPSLNGEDLPNRSIVYIEGVLGGYVFPKFILTHACLGLFLGVLIQFVWEDKTVTTPL